MGEMGNSHSAFAGSEATITLLSFFQSVAHLSYLEQNIGLKKRSRYRVQNGAILIDTYASRSFLSIMPKNLDRGNTTRRTYVNMYIKPPSSSSSSRLCGVKFYFSLLFLFVLVEIDRKGQAAACTDCTQYAGQ